MKYVGIIKGTQPNASHLNFILLAKQNGNQRSDKYIFGERLQTRVVNSRLNKILIRGPEIEGTDSKIRIEHFMGYYSVLLS